MRPHSALPHLRSPTLALVLIALSGCPKDDPFSVSETDATTDAGPTATSETTGTSSGMTSQTTTGEEATGEETTGAPSPVCGDGTIDDGEACDDQNDDDDDGCTAACTLAAGIKWTRSFDGGRGGDDIATDVAVDSSGRIYVVGVTERAGEGQDQLVLALDSDGGLLWERTFAGDGGGLDHLNSVALGDDGAIYVGGTERPSAEVVTASIRKLDADGDLLWSYADPIDSDLFTTVEGLVFSEGAIIGVGAEETGESVHCPVRSLDASTGALLWKVDMSGEGLFTSCIGVTAHGGSILTVGVGSDAEGINRDLNAQLNTADGSVESVILGEQAYVWNDLAVHPDLERTRVGRQGIGLSSDLVIRRSDPQGAELWTVNLGSADLADQASAVAALGDGGVLVAGSVSKLGQLANTFVARYDEAGVELWRSTYDNPGVSLNDSARGLDLGPGFAVVAGSEQGSARGTTCGSGPSSCPERHRRSASGQRKSRNCCTVPSDMRNIVPWASSDAKAMFRVVTSMPPSPCSPRSSHPASTRSRTRRQVEDVNARIARGITPLQSPVIASHMTHQSGRTVGCRSALSRPDTGKFGSTHTFMG